MVLKVKESESVKDKIELLAPGGDVNAVKAAILAGANAVYCGLDKFNARNRATNINLDKLPGILQLAHQYNRQIFITLNILIVESDIPNFIKLLNKLVKMPIDGIILQDIGMFYLVSKYYKSLKIHASTQVTTHNKGQIEFLKSLNAQRVNLSRELNIDEIKSLTDYAHQNSMLTEAFVHGSNCISFSGLCYYSSVKSGNSGNRGRCSQPCRDEYKITAAGKKFPFNLKDNSAFLDLSLLSKAGVDSLKIEGRIKKSDYVFTVVNQYRKQIDRIENNLLPSKDDSTLYKVFNRNFNTDFLKGKITNDAFIDNPRDYSIEHLSNRKSFDSSKELNDAQLKLYAEKDKIKEDVLKKTEALSIDKIPLSIFISGKLNMPLKVKVVSDDLSITVCSELVLKDKGSEALNEGNIISRLKSIDDTHFFIQKLDVSELEHSVFLPFKELTKLKNKLLLELCGYQVLEPNVAIPVIKSEHKQVKKPSLKVLIDAPIDVKELRDASVEIYYQLPNIIAHDLEELLDLFDNNKHLIPWFPEVIIGDDYAAALVFLDKLKASHIITNNLGVANAAGKRGIRWIAGPNLNLTNSYSLQALKEKANCAGAFLSNELSQIQLKGIKAPNDFQLLFSLYCPLVLMTSRQCLFHQVTGCHKTSIDGNCISKCSKTADVINSENEPFIIHKAQGNYHQVFNAFNYLNTEIVKDLPNKLDAYMVDLRCITTKTRTYINKRALVDLFKAYINDNAMCSSEIKNAIIGSTMQQYKRGI